MQPWERLVDEPGVWFARFERYRLLGPERSLDAAARAVTGNEGVRANRRWREMAERWRWLDRAEAWDEHEREEWRRVESTRRHFQKVRRLTLIDRLLTAVAAVFAAAEVDQVDQEAARKLLPVMRALLRDLLVAQRLELGEDDVVGAGSGWTFTADELSAALGRVGVARSTVGDGGSARDGLVRVLAELYPDHVSVRRVAELGGVHPGKIASGRAVDMWHSVLSEAVYASCLETLLVVVLREYGSYQPLQWAVMRLYQDGMEDLNRG